MRNELSVAALAVSVMAVVACAAPPAAGAGLQPWTLQPPEIKRTVTVKTLAECQAAATQPNTAVILAADIDAKGQDVFDIKASDILIDGRGHIISNAKTGVYSDNQVRRRIEIRNLKLDKPNMGFHLRRDQHVNIHHNTLSGCVGEGMHLENAFGSHGRFLEVHHNTVTGGARGCIVFQDGLTDARVYDNVCIDGGYRPQSYSNSALNFDSNIIRVEVYNNRTEGGTFGLGIRGQVNDGMHDCVIRDNTFTKAKSAGIRICYLTFRNVLRNNNVRHCPVGVYYQKAYRVQGNLLDGVTIENCPLPVLVEGPDAPTTSQTGQPRSTPPTRGNVDRLVLKDFAGPGPIVKITKAVIDHTVADAGPWKKGAAEVEGAAKLIWASFAHVTVTRGGSPVEGAEVACGQLKAATGKDGLALLGPLPAMEITAAAGTSVAQPMTIEAAHGGQKASATVTPDGSAIKVTLTLK